MGTSLSHISNAPVIRYVCSVCDRRFLRHSMLEVHIRTAHAGTEDNFDNSEAIMSSNNTTSIITDEHQQKQHAQQEQHHHPFPPPEQHPHPTQEQSVPHLNSQPINELSTNDPKNSIEQQQQLVQITTIHEHNTVRSTVEIGSQQGTLIQQAPIMTNHTHHPATHQHIQSLQQIPHNPPPTIHHNMQSILEDSMRNNTAMTIAHEQIAPLPEEYVGYIYGQQNE